MAEDLSLVPTDDLMSEVLSRFDHAAFIGMACNYTSGKDGSLHYYSRRWVGNSHTCVGLLTDLQSVILANTDEHKFEE